MYKKVIDVALACRPLGNYFFSIRNKSIQAGCVYCLNSCGDSHVEVYKHNVFVFICLFNICFVFAFEKDSLRVESAQAS